MQINTLNGIINIDLNTISLDDISEILSEFSVETDSLPDMDKYLRKQQ